MGELGPVINLLITLMIYGAIAYVVWWALSMLPAPFQMVGRIIFAIVVVVLLVTLLSSFRP